MSDRAIVAVIATFFAMFGAIGVAAYAWTDAADRADYRAWAADCRAAEAHVVEIGDTALCRLGAETLSKQWIP